MTEVTENPVLGRVSRDTGPGVTGDGIPVGLPMPRDPGLLTELDRRPLVTHFKGRRYPFPIPDGWFVVAESADLAPVRCGPSTASAGTWPSTGPWTAPPT